MGIVFGKTGSLELPYETLFTSPNYVIRKYDPMITADIVKTDDIDEFEALGRYIGIIGSPENLLNGQATSMPMSTPVLITSHLKDSEPSSHPNTREEVMSFVLPSEYTSITSVPTPLNPAITITEFPARVVAVKSFSGFCTSEVKKAICRRFYRDLVVQHASQFIKSALSSVSITQGRNADSLDSIQWQVARYHPASFTLPFLRRNEIWIEMDLDRTGDLMNTLRQKN
jgi:hypothetical protein